MKVNDIETQTCMMTLMKNNEAFKKLCRIRSVSGSYAHFTHKIKASLLSSDQPIGFFQM